MIKNNQRAFVCWIHSYRRESDPDRGVRMIAIVGALSIVFGGASMAVGLFAQEPWWFTNGSIFFVGGLIIGAVDSAATKLLRNQNELNKQNTHKPPIQSVSGS